MASKIETFSFSVEKDQDVIQHISKLKEMRQNASKYIVELIRRDIGKEENIEQKIRRLINEALKDKDFSTKYNVEDINEKLNGLFD